MATLIDNNSESLYYDYWYLGVYDPGEDCYPEMGQSFVAIDTYTELDSAKFYLTSYGTPPVGNIYSKIYASTGTHGVDALPTGSALATSDPVDSSLVTNTHPTYELYTFTFSGANRINLTSGTTYIIVVEYTEALTYANGIWAGFTDLQHAGNAASLFATWEVGGPWGSTNEDLIFYIYGTEYVPPVVDLPTYDRTSLEKGRFLQPIDINNLEEVSFIAGNTYHLDFPAYDENGNGLDISTGSCRWALSPYGEPNVVILQKEGVFTSTGSFRITLDAEDTRNLSGKFMHQASLRDWNGKRFIPSQGVITIVSSIPFTKASPEIYYVFPITDIGVRIANIVVWGENSIILVLIPDAVGYEVTYTVIIDGVTYTYTFTNAGDGVFYLLNPPNGAGVITVDGDYFWGAIVLYDVNQEYPFTIWDVDDVPTTIGDIVIDVIGGPGEVPGTIEADGLCLDVIENVPWDSTNRDYWWASCWSNDRGEFLVTGSTRDVVLKNSTGLEGSWQSYSVTVLPRYCSYVIWAGGSIQKYFASSSSGIYSSSDGVTWANVNSSYTDTIVYSPELGLLVGFCIPLSLPGTTFVVTSSNGTDWSTTNLLTGSIRWGDAIWSAEKNIFCVCWSDYVTSETKTFTSSNGTIWNAGTRLPAPEYMWNWGGIDYSPALNLFVMVTGMGDRVADGHDIWTSTDGLNWIQRDNPNGGWGRIRWGEELGVFVAISNWGEPPKMMTSTNGINWTELPIPQTSSVSWNDYKFPPLDIVYSPELEMFVFSGDAYYDANDAIMTGSMCSQLLTINMYYSPKGDWTTDGYYDYSAWSPELGIYLAVNSTGDALVAKSPDGITWTGYNATSDNGQPDESPYCDGGLLWIPTINKFIAGTAPDFDGIGLAVSSDGINWTEIYSTVISPYTTCMAYNPTSGLIVAGGDGHDNGINMYITYMLTTTDAINVTRTIIAQSPIATAYNRIEIQDICYSSKFNKFFAIRTEYPVQGYSSLFKYYIISSSNGIAWETVSELYSGATAPTADNLCPTKIIWSDDLELFLVLNGFKGWDSYQDLARSSDGVNWTTIPMPVGRISEIIYGDGIFLVIVKHGTSSYSMLSSPDGVTWRNTMPPSGLDLDLTEGMSYSEDLGIFVASGWSDSESVWKVVTIRKNSGYTASGTVLSSNENGSIQVTTATSGTTTSSWGTGTGTRIVITVHPI